jgi:hypothetical protein
MDPCGKYRKVKDETKTIKNIEKFCSLLRANKVKDSKEAFVNLPLVVQCMFLHHAWGILSNKSKHSEDSYRSAFYLFKLFRGKDMKEIETYLKYNKLPSLEKLYKLALEWNRENTSSGSKSRSRKGTASSTSRSSKKYEKEHQRYEAPKDELDPLYVYYTSLYSENPASRLAITWLTEHGVLEDEDRNKIVKLYLKLVAKGKLIK